MKTFTKLSAILFLIVLTILTCNMQVLATSAIPNLTPTTGSLTIKKYAKGTVGHETENIPLAGVTFKIYKVTEGTTSLTEPAGAATAQDTTGTNGQVVFPNLELGRYLVVESDAPINVTSKIENFLVDIPSTNAAGTDLVYDVVAEPKNNTAYGTMTLTKKGINNTNLKGVSFLLQKQNATTSAWEDYPNTAGATLSTNTAGQIQLSNLPAGSYRFVETNLGTNTGYILDNKTTYGFTVSFNSTTSLTEVTPSTITVNNDKPDLTKTITSVKRATPDTNTVQKSGTNVEITENAITTGEDEYTLDIGDIVTYKLESDIPATISRLATYEISDEMDDGLTLDSSKIVVKIGETVFVKDTDYTLTSTEQSFKVTFTEDGKTKLNGNEKVEIYYDATLNSNANATVTGNSDRTNLKYSTIVENNYLDANNTETTYTTENKIATVYTGGLIIEKRENTNTGTLLANAVFKLAATEADAKAHNYIKDSTGTEITLTTNGSGRATYTGLSYGDYYLVETQAPTYTEGETTKYYNMLNKPVKITVNSTSASSNANIVINRKPTVLPATGAISTLVVVALGIALILLAKKVNKKDNE